MFDFASFYKKYNVNISRLKRDYEKNPLGKVFKEIYIEGTNKLHSRRYIIEKPYKEDIEYLYIESNIPLKDILGYFNLKRFTFGEIRRFYDIKKSYLAQHKNTEKYYMENYGVKSSSCLKENKEKAKQTCFKHYGVENPAQCPDVVDKIFKKRKINGTIISSSFEEKVYDLLKEKFINIKRQYKSKVYPFHCDFYIPELDLYIEIQGHPSHGKEPYNKNDKKHQEILNLWQRKIIELKKDKNRVQYEDYIRVWTISDPKKRNIAKENNLNYLEFFNINQFLKWYNNI